jgi:hypothetical protein
MDQNKNWIVLGDRVKASSITNDLFSADHGLKAEVSELVILDVERLCGGHN